MLFFIDLVIFPYYLKRVFFELRFGEEHWTVSTCSTFWIHLTNSNLHSITKPSTHGPMSMADTNDRHCRPTDAVDRHFDCRHWRPIKLRATTS